MLRAIVFDCDGVIADSEPLHLAMFQKVLGEEGICLTTEEYFNHYLALDDRSCFAKAHSDRGISLDEARLQGLIARKAAYLEPAFGAHLRLFPGALEFIRLAAGKYPLAIASGALGREIELIVEMGGVRDCFQAIISAGDVSRSKPHPDPFIKALEALNARQADKIGPGECLVIEDSIYGIRAAHLAGMRCLAITNSYSADQLSSADHIVESLADLSLEAVEAVMLR